MDRREIDEISDSFREAWEDYFGQKLKYVPLDKEKTEVDTLYDEDIGGKVYDYTKAKEFHGTLKEVMINEEGGPFGDKTEKLYSITYVTKELVDQGIDEIDLESIIVVDDRKFAIRGKQSKVQFGEFRVFTRLEVIEIEN